MAGKKHIAPALLEQYVLGLTNREENEKIESILAQNPDLAEEIQYSQKLMEEFAMEYTIRAPKDLKQKILNTSKDKRRVHSVTSRNMTTPFSWFTGAAALLALAFGFLSFLLYIQSKEMNQQFVLLGKEVQELKNQNTQLLSQKSQINQQFSLLKDVNTTHVHLRNAEIFPKALIIVYWNEAEKNAYLNVVDLPAIPKNKSLQLWADVGGEMINMGVLDDLNTDLLPAIPFVPNAAAFNITMEEKGGSDHPNVEQIFANGRLL